MECSSPASGHRASRNSRKREASPVSSLDSALAARLWHPPLCFRASAASSRVPNVASPERICAAFSSSARLRNCLAHALQRNTSNAPKRTACPVHVPHPKHLCIHPVEGILVPGTYAYAHGSSFENASVFSFLPAARADSVCFVSSLALTFSRTRRSSSRCSARRSPIVESVEHPEASVSSCSTRHTLSDATDARVPLPRAAVRFGSDRIVHRN